jgi:Anti-sigma-28 factor, FlgM
MNPKVTEIKRQLETGQYRIDAYAIADAMIRWAEAELESGGRLTPRARTQNECSKPDSPSSLSMKMAPAGPSTTVPIAANSALAVVQAA